MLERQLQYLVPNRQPSASPAKALPLT
ncbi:hypothetical protein B3ORF46 [Pseudomonas phage B3]|uniref:Uncharacterized protein n=1 Tax=Pseudomonas phage B3 TaxID=151599 RepID=Q5ZQW9_9CAUD|nr:hypothetical protein B3ORF46 [Pseudomonas phage B3]AAQ13964.1 hypothetical protein B3ORF46 [Pseudomonas phage B3]